MVSKEIYQSLKTYIVKLYKGEVTPGELNKIREVAVNLEDIANEELQADLIDINTVIHYLFYAASVKSYISDVESYICKLVKV